MASEQDRLAHIFIWRQAGAPDLEYARQVLNVVNPEATRLLSGDNPPVSLFAIAGSWPTDPWTRALLDMRATPAPEGTQWSDTSHYDLAGWQGTDARTGERLFVVMAYRKANVPRAEPFSSTPAPSAATIAPVGTGAIPHVPYYPQHPTGPITWPSKEEEQPPPTILQGRHPMATGASQPAYGQGNTASVVSPDMVAPSEPPSEGYEAYYAGIPPRLVAGLIDVVCVTILVVGALLLYRWLVVSGEPHDFGTWVGTYWAFIILALLIFAAYHVTQWTLWGQTLGKSLLDVKVVDAMGRKPQFGRALLRMSGYIPSFLLGGLGGFLLIAFDARRQALHDKIAETYVVPMSPPAPVPAGLPGYPALAHRLQAEGIRSRTAPALGMANIAGPQSYEVVRFAPEVDEPANQIGRSNRQTGEDRGTFREIASLDQNMNTVVNVPELAEQTEQTSGGAISTARPNADLITGSLTERTLQRSLRTGSTERARDLFRQAIEQMEQSAQQTERGYRIEASGAQRAAQLLQEAADLVPGSVVYRYYLGVALRYADGFEAAISEFRRVLELDPSHYEARQQVAYGQRWHDAFAYPPWTDEAILKPDTLLPEPLLALIPADNRPVTRLVLLREGNMKVVSVLSRTPRASWARPLGPELPAHIDIVLSRTPSGPIMAFYVVVEDRPDDPYKAETFLNPHDPGGPTYDACQLGQNLLSQLHRQDHIYLVFVDEENKLMMARRLDFDPQTQVNINRCLYEVQTLPSQIMDLQRFQAAAEWHMEHFSLDQVK